MLLTSQSPLRNYSQLDRSTRIKKYIKISKQIYIKIIVLSPSKVRLG
jgi:hypothetical protein